MTVTFNYSKDVTMPRRLAASAGDQRNLSIADARRLAADGVGFIVETITAESMPLAELSEAEPVSEPPEVEDE